VKPRTLFALLLTSLLAFAQDQADTKQRLRAAHDLAKTGQDAIPALQRYVTDPDLSVRLEAVKSLDDISGPKTVDPLVLATKDPDPEMQIRATDGLVNAYLPGYLKTGISGTLARAGTSVKAKFTDTNDQVIDAFVDVRPEVIAALGHLAASGASLESRANACRAIGILRGQAAIPDLVQALHSKDSQVMYEALIAVQKIRDTSAGPKVAFLLHDLEERIQIAALDTTGILRNTDAAPDVRDVLAHARSLKVHRSAVSALAMIAQPADRVSFERDLTDKDDAIRAAAAEGLGRLRDPADKPVLEKAFAAERKLKTRLSIAFALVKEGDVSTGDQSPLTYLVNTLNQASYKGVAIAFLIELTRDLQVRQAVYPLLPRATKDEKIELGRALAQSGDKDSIPYLEALQMDTDPEVARESIRSLRSLRARL
jgi:HEAT repeat protein